MEVMPNGTRRNLNHERGRPAHPMRLRNNHRFKPNQKTRLAGFQIPATFVIR